MAAATAGRYFSQPPTAALQCSGLGSPRTYTVGHHRQPQHGAPMGTGRHTLNPRRRRCQSPTHTAPTAEA